MVGDGTIIADFGELFRGSLVTWPTRFTVDNGNW